MTSTFHHIALIGKYHTPAAGVPSDAASEALQRIAGYVRSMGCEVILDTQSAIYAGLPDYPSMDVDGLGRHCDLAWWWAATAPCWACAAIWRAMARRWSASTRGAWVCHRYRPG
jgi:hypothetical protein